MTKLLAESSVLDILPSSVKDSDIIAAAISVDTQFSKTIENVSKINIYSYMSVLEDDILDHLLYQHHITNYEGKALAVTKQEKVNLIINSSAMHKIKGTRAAIENVLVLLNMRGSVSEWFEYEGDPYYFKVDLNVENRGFDERQYFLLDQLIRVYKNCRSWLEAINIFMTVQGHSYRGCVTQLGTAITINPYSSGEIITEASQYGTGYTIMGAHISTSNFE